MKKSIIIGLLIFVFVSWGVFAGAGKDSGGASPAKASTELTLYYSHAADWTDPIIKEFQDKTGVHVNLVGAGTGELVSRIRAEKENPLADILWGGNPDSYDVILDLLEVYKPQEIASADPATYDPAHHWHGTTIDPMVVIYNPKLVAPADAPKGWGDLINPKFKGMIAHADPARSGSAFMALIIQLETMGGDNPTGWKYMRDFVTNLDGKLIGSSSGTFKGVADGEYMVGITYEEGGLKYQAAGADLKVVYPIEGSSKVPSPIGIIKGAKNLENAKKFVDFCLGKDVQTYMGTVSRRSVRTDIALPPEMVSNDKLGDAPYDTVWIAANKDRIMDTWKNYIIGK
jgi:iron(III) transport system substrate-binding protein